MLTDPILKSKVDALWDKFWSGGKSFATPYGPTPAQKQAGSSTSLGGRLSATVKALTFPLVKGKT